ncbi:hypothetical protein FDUTEX481_08449 [Tolypothrix sp. PCC 7601]|nr:hypothetical protein FDUTEX481_08449 [Tolypothrix sp. PCC 7601]
MHFKKSDNEFCNDFLAASITSKFVKKGVKTPLAKKQIRYTHQSAN